MSCDNELELVCKIAGGLLTAAIASNRQTTREACVCDAVEIVRSAKRQLGINVMPYAVSDIPKEEISLTGQLVKAVGQGKNGDGIGR